MKRSEFLIVSEKRKRKVGVINVKGVSSRLGFAFFTASLYVKDFVSSFKKEYNRQTERKKTR